MCTLYGFLFLSTEYENVQKSPRPPTASQSSPGPPSSPGPSEARVFSVGFVAYCLWLLLHVHTLLQVQCVPTNSKGQSVYTCVQAPNPTAEAGGTSHQDDQPSTRGQGIISHTYLCNMSALWHRHYIFSAMVLFQRCPFDNAPLIAPLRQCPFDGALTTVASLVTDKDPRGRMSHSNLLLAT